MAKASQLIPFGVFVRPLFVAPDLCAQWVDLMGRSGGREARVFSQEKGKLVLANQVRKVRMVRVTDEAITEVNRKLRDLRTQIADHFQVSLQGHEPPKFLSYKKGDFFFPHRDNGDAGSVPDIYQKRRISVVIFLNDHSSQPKEGCYSGGELVLNLFTDPKAAHLGLGLEGESGLLIAFRSDVMHEVKAVRHGHRHTIVSWFY